MVFIFILVSRFTLIYGLTYTLLTDDSINLVKKWLNEYPAEGAF